MEEEKKEASINYASKKVLDTNIKMSLDAIRESIDLIQSLNEGENNTEDTKQYKLRNAAPSIINKITSIIVDNGEYSNTIADIAELLRLAQNTYNNKVFTNMCSIHKSCNFVQIGCNFKDEMCKECLNEYIKQQTNFSEFLQDPLKVPQNFKKPYCPICTQREQKQIYSIPNSVCAIALRSEMATYRKLLEVLTKSDSYDQCLFCGRNNNALPLHESNHALCSNCFDLYTMSLFNGKNIQRDPKFDNPSDKSFSVDPFCPIPCPFPNCNKRIIPKTIGKFIKNIFGAKNDINNFMHGMLGQIKYLEESFKTSYYSEI
jgi:hypothetical protein